jgi:hypothetical protein
MLTYMLMTPTMCVWSVPLVNDAKYAQLEGARNVQLQPAYCAVCSLHI